MRFVKRTLSAFLALVMVFTMLPLQVWASETQQSANDSVNFSSIVADGAGDDRALEPDGNDVDTYIFKIEGVEEPVSTQYVKNGEVVYEPEAPAKEGQKFMGWFDADGKEFDASKVLSLMPNGTTYTYTAKYQQLYYVFFMDGTGEDAAVVHTQEGVPGTPIKTDFTFNAGLDNGVAGWYYDKTYSSPVSAGGTIGNENITLYPKIETGHWIHFDTDGGEPVSSVFVKPGETTKEPAAPKREGYTFTGWYDGNTKFTFGGRLNESVTLKAKWQGNQVKYKVFYWQQNADDNGYSFVEEAIKEGTAGEKPNLRIYEKNYKYFHYKGLGEGEENKVIAGDGSTIINVYYDRNTYTLKFELNGDKPKQDAVLEINDQEITGDGVYTFKARYEQDISKMWPTAGDITQNPADRNGIYYFESWTGGERPQVSKRFNLTDDLIGTAKNGGTITFTARWVRNLYRYELHYQLESLENPREYVDSEQYRQTAYYTETDSWNAKDIVGFTPKNVIGNAEQKRDSSGKYYEVIFKYDRNEHELSFYNFNDTVKKQNYKYDADISDAYFVPERPTSLNEKYQFMDWYTTEDCLDGTEFNFEDATMPDDNLVLYAKWAAEPVEVKVHLGMGAGSDVKIITVPYGEKIPQDELPTIAGAPEGHGWATYEQGKYLAFNLDRPLYADIEIFPYWISNEKFRVTYDLGEGVVGNVTDPNSYRSTAHAEVLDIGSDVVKPQGKIFLGWKQEGDKTLYRPGMKIQILNANVTLKAQWGDQAVKTTLTYHPGYEGAKPVEEHWANNEMVTLKTADELNFTRDGYEFLGWATSAGSEVVYHAGDAIRVNTKNADTDNHLYAVWERTVKPGDPITVEVRVNGEQVNASEYVTVVKDTTGTASLKAENTGKVYSLSYTYMEKNCADFYLNKTDAHKFTGYTVEVTYDGTAVEGAKPSITGTNTGWHLDNIPGGATVTVSLTRRVFTVKYEASPAEGGMVSLPSETVPYGDDAQGSTATAEDGYYFVEWQDADGQQVGTNAAFTPEGAITANATYTAVFAQQKEITIKAKDLSKEYDGTAIEANSAQLETIEGELGEGHRLIVTTKTSEDVINVSQKDGKHQIDTYRIEDSAGRDVTNQYSVTTQEGTLSITPKPVTITVNNSEKQYGEVDPEFTGEVKGLVEDDALGVVTFTRTNTEEAVGVYPNVLTADYTANENYKVSVDNGDFEIKQNTTAKVVVTIVGRTETEEYNGNTHTVEGYEVTSITLNDTATNLYQTTDVALADGKEAKASGTNADTYNMGLTADSFQNNNQNFANVEFVVTDGYLTITPATMPLSAVSYDKMYDGFSHGGTVSGAPAGATLVYSTDGGTSWSDKAPTVKDVADGTINVKVKATLANYRDAVETYTLNVKPRAVTLTSGNDTKPYGQPAQNNTVTVTGDDFVDGEGVTYSNFASLTLVGSKDNTFDYTLNGGTEERNYIITKDYGTLTVTDEVVVDKDVVTKTHDPKEGDYKLGDTVTFTIKITNIYNVDKTLIVEERPGVTIVGDVPGTIGPGKTIELTATYQITEDDIKNGSFVNTVTVTLGDIPFEGKDTVELEEAEGALTVEKTIVEPKKEAYGLNDTIHYQIKVTNSGNVTLENITLSDVLKVGEGDGETLTATQPDDFTGTLAPGASVTYTANYTVKEADLGKTIVNTATATGSYTDKDSTKTVEGEDEVPATTAAVNPDLMVEKTITNGDTFAMGDSIEYKIVVTNSGNVTLTGIDVTDSLVDLENATNLTLKPNEKVTFKPIYQVTMGDVLAGQVVNTATATAGDVKASGDATATITGLDNLRAEVVLNSRAYTYDGKEHTVADGELTVKLGDAVQTDFSVEFAEGTATATDKDVLYNEKGEVIGYPVTATAGDITIWYGGKNVTDKFDGKIDITDGELIITPKKVTITVDDKTKKFGTDDPAFTGKVEGLVKSDDLGTVTYIRNNSAEDVGTYEEVLTAGYMQNGNYSVTVNKGDFVITENTDEVVVNIVGKHDTMTYNGSEQVVTGYDVRTITIDDEATTLYTSDDFSLKPGVEDKASGTNAGTYNMGLTADSFRNNNQNFANVKFVVTDGWLRINPATMTLTAVGYDGKYDGGDHGGTVTAPEGATLRYSTDGGTNWSDTAPTVKNVTNETITVTVKATLANYRDAVETYTLNVKPRAVTLTSGNDTKPYGQPAQNNTVTVTGDDFVDGEGVTYKDFASLTLVGSKDNTFDYTLNEGTEERNYIITKVEGTLEVTAPENLNGYVAKTHEGQNFKVGDTVIFKITVTNIYAVNAKVTLEEKAGMTFENGLTTLEDVLDPGETETYTATHTLTDADFENGGVNNTVEVTLDPEGEEPEIPGTDTDEVKLEKNPNMSVDKTVLERKESYRVGDTIQYQITVKNTGNVTLHDLELTDVMNADGKVTFPAGTDLTRETLKVGDSWAVTCSYVVRAADEGKEISNKATVIAHDPETKDPEKEAGDTTDGEQVQNLYRLTIHYRNGAGNAVAGSYSARYHVGDSFKIDSPIVAGYYDPQIRSISSGANGMPAQDLEYVVIYTAIPVPAPDPGPGPAPNPGPGPGPAPNPGPDDGDDDDDTPPVPNPEQEQPPQPQDFEIDPDDYTLTELEDNETPLANLDLDGHTCCILHLLLMLAAMVVLGFYTKSRKKHQARIFELKRILAAEEDHPDDPQQP